MSDIHDELSEVLGKLDRATPGPWVWSSNGNIVPIPYASDSEIAAVYSEHDDDGLIPSNAAAIILAVNFLRKHGAELLAKVAPDCAKAGRAEGE